MVGGDKPYFTIGGTADGELHVTWSSSENCLRYDLRVKDTSVGTGMVTTLNKNMTIGDGNAKVILQIRQDGELKLANGTVLTIKNGSANSELRLASDAKVSNIASKSGSDVPALSGTTLTTGFTASSADGVLTAPAAQG